MDAAAAPFVSAQVKAVIRAILTPSSELFNPYDLVWERTTKPLVVYRGQCNESKKNIPRIGDNPLEISLEYGRPISTSKQLTDAIWAFACKPGGRLFQINVVPGVPIADLQKSVNGNDFSKEVFQFLKDELPAGSGWANASVGQLRAVFFKKLNEEKEVLLGRAGVFKKESGEIEDWASDEVAQDGKTMYVTGFFPKRAGRRRTRRGRKSSRRR